MKTFATVVLFYCSIAFFTSCGNVDSEALTTTTDSAETAPNVEDEPIEIDKDNALLKSISDTYFWVDKANDVALFNEPCQVVDESLEIYYDENEISGWFINYATYHRNYNYLVKEVREVNGEIVVRIVDSNDYDLNDATIEAWSFRKDGEFLNWDRMDYPNTTFLLPYSQKETVIVQSCTDVEAILNDFPNDWVELTEIPDSDAMYISECECESGTVGLGLFDENGKMVPYYMWTGGCDGDSEKIKSIEKANNNLTIKYSRFDTEITLEIDYDYFLTHVGTFRYTSNGEATTRFFTPNEYAENFDKEECDTEEH